MTKSAKTEKANQHYVPQFYLRNFCWAGNEKQISLAHIKTQKVVIPASLAGQAKLSYFYGEDGVLENELSEIEGHQAELIRRILSRKFIPAKNTIGHIELLALVEIMRLRNPSSSNKLNDAINSSFRAAFSRSEHYTEAKDYTYGYDNAIALSLGMVAQAIPLLSDLHFKVLVNNTSVPFITSDNPSVRYNQFMEISRVMHGSTGTVSLGLQIFLPLSPQMLVLFYDPWSYKVGQRNPWIQVSNENDVMQLNRLQILNSIDVIYFTTQLTESSILSSLKEAARFSKPGQIKTEELTNVLVAGEQIDGSILNTTQSECRIGLTLSFVKLSTAAKYYNTNKGLVHIRKKCEPLVNKILAASGRHIPNVSHFN